MSDVDPDAAPQIVRFGLPRAVRAVRVVLGIVLATAGLFFSFLLASLIGRPVPPDAVFARFWAFGAPGVLVAASGFLTVRDITFDVARKRYRMRRGVLPFVKSDFGDASAARYIFVGSPVPPTPPADTPTAEPYPVVLTATGVVVCEIVWDRRGLARTRLSEMEMRWMRERRVVVSPANAAPIALRLADALELPLMDARPQAAHIPSPAPLP